VVQICLVILELAVLVCDTWSLLGNFEFTVIEKLLGLGDYVGVGDLRLRFFQFGVEVIDDWKELGTLRRSTNNLKIHPFR